VAVFLISAAVLIFEIGLTRIFSVLLRFHFVFLAVSCAICGLGLGGMLSVSASRVVRQRLADGTVLAGLALALGVSLALSVVVLLRTRLSAHVFEPLTIPSVALVPFALAGALLSYAFHRHAAWSGRLYFADLSGAAVGSLGVILALNAVGGTNVPFVAGALALLAAVILAAASHQRGLTGAAILCLVGVVALLGANIDGRIIDLPVLTSAQSQRPHVKPLFRELGDPSVGAKIVATEWNAFARTDAVANAGTDVLFVYTDGDVPTNMVPFDGDLTPQDVSMLRTFIGFLAFASGPRDEVLLIGPGAGLDVLFGLMAGSRHMVGVELNPSIPRMMYDLRDFNGSLYAYDNVEMHIAEGRSFVASDRRRYDLIYTALTKTATTSTSGLALVEGYVYTKEAFADYLDHLTDSGRIGLVTDNPVLAARALLTVVSVLADRGIPVQDGCQHVALLQIGPQWGADTSSNPYRCLLLARRTPFPESDRDALMTAARILKLEPLFVPGRSEGYLYLDRISQRGDTIDSLVAASTDYNLSPVTDDRPFFIDLSRTWPPELRALATLCVGALVAALWLGTVMLVLGPCRPARTRPWLASHALGAAVALCMPAPWLFRLGVAATASVAVGALALRQAPAEARDGARRLGALTAYFVVLGIGFLAIEVALIQPLIRFLGYPTLTLSVVVFGLLIGGAAGSLVAQRWPDGELPCRAAVAAACIALIGVALRLGLGPLFAAALPLPIIARSLIGLAVVLPLGFALGIPFPTGIRMARGEFDRFIPCLWGINGLTSAVGSIGAMLIAREFGFPNACLAGALLYLALIGLAPRIRG